MTNSGYTISNFRKTLEEKLRQYIEAQYHIKTESLVNQRRELLGKEGVLSTEVFLETNRLYKTCSGYESAGLDKFTTDILQELSKNTPKTGVVPTPFSHQIDALNGFIVKNKNIVISTGTGSGKTESFLYPLLVKLLSLSRDQNNDGVMKSLILYPMNALVADQTTRLRKILGSKESQRVFNKTIGRNIKFANYTSLTPYAGTFQKKKNRTTAKSLKKLYGLDSSDKEASSYFEQLVSNNKIPQKNDLRSFLNSLESSVSVESLSDNKDPEQILRAEIQSQQPDLLVTNFSMLEYMMLRPIEQPIFDNTRKWLSENQSNCFTLVLDEAHIYNGISGSEVSLLIRRLKDRLGAKNGQFRVMLASASLGDNDSIIRENAEKLTGEPQDTFDIIKHEEVVLIDEYDCSYDILSILDNLTPSNIANYKNASRDEQFEIYDGLMKILFFRGLPKKDFEDRSIGELAYSALSGLDIINELKRKLVNPHPSQKVINYLKELCDSLNFKSQNISNLFETIVNLGSLASTKGAVGTNVLLPVRAHNMFRGLPAIYLCINQDCGPQNSLYGKMFADRRTLCDCGSKVYELYTHRECGSAYIKGYWNRESDHQSVSNRTVYPDGGLHKSQELTPVYLCIEKHNTKGEKVVYVNPRTGVISESPQKGHLETSISLNTDNFSLKTVDGFSGAEKAWFHSTCQCCEYETLSKQNKSSADDSEDISGTLEIKPLGTIGDEPFTYLVKEQFRLQPVSKPDAGEDTNKGRKSLIFSDGRQKAARLAKNLPETIQRDVFRSYFITAYKWLQTSKADEVLCDEDAFDLSKIKKTLDPEKLYYGFLEICSRTGKLFFEGNDRLKFSQHLDDYRNFRVIPSDAIPVSFFEYLIAILCKPRYNITDLAIAGIRVKPAKVIAKRTGLEPGLVEAFFAKRARDFLQAGAVNVNHECIAKVFNYYPKEGQGREWRLSQKGAYKYSRRNRGEEVSSNNYKLLNDHFVDRVLVRSSTDNDGSYKVNLSKLYIDIGVDNTWFECQHCLYLTDIVLPDGRCPACGSGSSSVTDFDDDSVYFKARKLFWRNPIREALVDIKQEMFIEVGEHTAQLNYRDNDEKIMSTVSDNELKFQDIVDTRNMQKSKPVDVLSSTTTMEVGIDIGGLIAVAMRNVPPQRQNYQQRAGRAGRRGASFSTVITYCQNGSHDSFYFKNPTKMISGPMAPIHLDPGQRKLATRHYMSVIIGKYFHRAMEILGITELDNPNIFSHLGSLESFLGDNEPNFVGLKAWALGDGQSEIKQLTQWYEHLMGDMSTEELSHELDDLEKSLSRYQEELRLQSDVSDVGRVSQLLEVLFDVSKLPSYAFPTDLVQLEIFKYNDKKIVPVERPTFGISQAIQELAPGRGLVINKNLYQVGTILNDSIYGYQNSKAEKLFHPEKRKTYFICEVCKTLHTSENVQCCNSKKLRSIEVVKPKYVVPRYIKNGNLGTNDIIYTSSQEAQIVNNGQVVDASKGKCLRFKVLHEIYKSEQVKIARINEGIPQTHGKGFLVCTRCGATSPPHHFRGDYHMTDYPLKPNGRSEPCTGEVKQVSIGYDFLTDLSSIKLKLSEDFEQPDRTLMPPALNAAAYSLALAIRNAFAIHKDIDKSDLGFGARIVLQGDEPWLEIFFYDDNAGGAEYSSEVAGVISQIFSEAEKVLQDCNCDSRCYKCLSSYDSRFIDNKLNRHLGLALLRYIRHDELQLDGDIDLIARLKKCLYTELRALGLFVNGSTVTGGTGKVVDIELRPSLTKDKILDANKISITPYELAQDLAPVIESIRNKVSD